MPFKSMKQAAYLSINKPEVAAKFKMHEEEAKSKKDKPTKFKSIQKGAYK